MEAQAETGRRLVLAVVAALLTLSAAVIIASNVVLGSERLPQQIVRFSLTVGLCIYLIRGANWARWVVGVLFSFGGIVALLGGLKGLSAGPAGSWLLLMALIYLVSAAILLFLPSVRAFFGVGTEESANEGR